MQSTFPIKVSAASGISAGRGDTGVHDFKAIMGSQLLVLCNGGFRVHLAGGVHDADVLLPEESRGSSFSWASTGSLSLVPVISPTGVPSAFASSAATGSVTAVK